MNNAFKNTDEPKRPREMEKTHSEEFKREVVRIALTSRFTRWQIASDLGLELWTLNRWIRELEEGPISDCTAPDLLNEISRLRNENAALRRQIDTTQPERFSTFT